MLTMSHSDVDDQIDYEEEDIYEESDDGFDCYDDFEYGAKAKRCPKANAGIKSCVKKVKGGIHGMSKAIKSKI